MDPEAEYAGDENKYGVAQSETQADGQEATPADTDTNTESRGLFGFGGKSDTSSTPDSESLEQPTATQGTEDTAPDGAGDTTAGGTDYSADSIDGGNSTGGTDYSAATALDGGNPTGGTDYSGASVDGGNPTGGTDYSGTNLPGSTNY